MNKYIRNILGGAALAFATVTAQAAVQTGIPYWLITQEYSNGQLYVFVNIGPGQVSYYIGNNDAMAGVLDNAGRARKAVQVNTDASGKITAVTVPGTY